jgi:cytochrome c553
MFKATRIFVSPFPWVVGVMKFFCLVLFFAVLGISLAHAAPDIAAGERKAALCMACHGLNGNSVNPEFPSLAAQAPLYIYYQLLQFREGRRASPIMANFAKPLTDADMKDIGAYFAAQKSVGAGEKIADATIEAGKAVAARSHCGSCHMPTYVGQNHIPRVAGLPVEYSATQMRGFKTGARQDIDGTMASAAQPLTEKEILDVAGYLASLK